MAGWDKPEAGGQETSWQGLARRQSPEARCPAFSLVLWQQLLFSPPCLGLYGLRGSRFWAGTERAKQPCAQAGSVARVAPGGGGGERGGVSVPPSSMGSTGPKPLVLAPVEPCSVRRGLRRQSEAKSCPRSQDGNTYPGDRSGKGHAAPCQTVTVLHLLAMSKHCFLPHQKVKR